MIEVLISYTSIVKCAHNFISCIWWFSGLALSSRTDTPHNTSEAITPTTPTSSSQHRLGGAPNLNVISGLASGPGMDLVKGGTLAGMLGPPPKTPRGRKKIKAENPSGPLLVVPYPILASGTDQSCVTITAKEGKTYRCETQCCLLIPFLALWSL